MFKFIINGDLGRRITREIFVFSGQSSMHAWFQSGEQSKIKRDQMTHYGIHEVCDICVRKSKHGGRVVRSVWWLDFPLTYKSHTHCNFKIIVMSYYGENESIGEVAIMMSLVSYISIKATQVSPCCTTPSNKRIGVLPFLHFQSISNVIEGDTSTLLMTHNCNSLLFDEILIFVGQLLNFWHLCTM